MIQRLDVFLTENKHFNSRKQAQNAIEHGCVAINGKVQTGKSIKVKETDKVTIDLSLIQGDLKYVSRGGLKLEKAASEFNISFKEKIVLDVGASTGGFTDCALLSGAKKVYALDVGSGQLAQKLRADNRVEVIENANFRTFGARDFNEKIDIIVCDVSFISLSILASNFKSILGDVGELVVLIKPQFECGKQIADKFRGVINSKEVHLDVLSSIITKFMATGFKLLGLTYSPIKGGSGNIEYLAYFVPSLAKDSNIDISACINSAFNNF